MFPKISVSPGIVSAVLSPVEARRFIDEWVSVYADKRSIDCIKEFKWHLFSGGDYKSVEAEEALIEYRSHSAIEYVVIDNKEEVVFTTEQRPEKVALSDFYVCPRNLAWTMAFTHEDGWLGPYFAKHPEYERLEQENQAQLKKQEEKARAKKMGWA